LLAGFNYHIFKGKINDNDNSNNYNSRNNTLKAVHRLAPTLTTSVNMMMSSSRHMINIDEFRLVILNETHMPTVIPFLPGMHVLLELKSTVL